MLGPGRRCRRARRRRRPSWSLQPSLALPSISRIRVTRHEEGRPRVVRFQGIEMREALVRLNEQLASEYGIRIAARTGVNTGEVIVGQAVADQKLATGDAVNVAARLEHAAEPGEVLLGEETYDLVRETIAAEPAGQIEAKGKSRPLVAWRLLGLRPDVPAFARNHDAFVGAEASSASCVMCSTRRCESHRARSQPSSGRPASASPASREMPCARSRGRAAWWSTVRRGRRLTYLADGAIASARCSPGSARSAVEWATIGAATSRLGESWETRSAWRTGGVAHPLVVGTRGFRPPSATMSRKICSTSCCETRRRCAIASSTPPTAIRCSSSRCSPCSPTIQRLRTRPCRRRSTRSSRPASIASSRRAGCAQRASVEGRLFHAAPSQSCCRRTRPNGLGGTLLALTRKELLRPDRSLYDGDDGFRFNHVLIRDVAYASMPKELRADLHDGARVVARGARR